MATPIVAAAAAEEKTPAAEEKTAAAPPSLPLHYYYFITTIAPRSADLLQQTAIQSWLACPFIKVISVNHPREVAVLSQIQSFDSILKHPRFSFRSLEFEGFLGSYFVPFDKFVEIASGLTEEARVAGELKDNAVGKSDKPTLNSSDKPTLNSSDKPTLNSSDKPTLNSSDKPTLNSSDKPGPLSPTNPSNQMLVCLINSDIILGLPTMSVQSLEQQLHKISDMNTKHDLVICRRHDFHKCREFESVKGPSLKRPWGIDIFFCSSKLLALLQQHKTQFRIGLPYWDYYVPMFTLHSGLTLVENFSPLFFHKIHDTRWSVVSYRFMQSEIKKNFDFLKRLAEHQVDPYLLNRFAMSSVKMDVQPVQQQQRQPPPPKRPSVVSVKRLVKKMPPKKQQLLSAKRNLRQFRAKR